MLSNTRRNQTDKRAAKYPKMCPIQRNLWPAIMLNVMLVLSCMQLQVESAQQLPELSLETELRSARLMRFLGEPIQQNFNRQRRVGGGPGGPRVRPSVDHLNRSPAWRSPLPPPVLAAAPPQIRREFNNNWPYNGNNNNNAATRFAHAKDAPVLDVGKNQFYRIKDGAQYNYHANQYTTQNFKASQPNFEQNKHSIYTPIQQYAIPVEANKYLNYADSGSKQNPTQTLQNHNQLGQTSNSYAVYEDTENGVKSPVNLGLGYQQSNGQQPQVSKEAESYLHFMSTNDYFLPRRDPNYKQLDAERDQQLNYQQQKLIQKEQLQQQQQEHKQQQQLQLQQQQQEHKQQQQQQLQLQLQQQQQQQVYRQAVPQRHHTSDSSVSSSYNKPLRVSDLFFQQDPAPPSSAVVRGSYQAGQNAFVVKSDGNKSVKHILSTTLSSKTTQSQTPPPPPAYTKSWYSAHKTETPEPLRFEFTEHDAIKGSSSYTNAPKATKYYYETRTSTPRTVPTVSTAPIPDIPQSVKESQIVVESKDTHNTDFVNKRPQEQGHLETPIVATDSAEAPKDNEALCEKICANVYDENDEIVCGSDGYMYTGESQLECYSSCLNIEVSIKSKGSCA